MIHLYTVCWDEADMLGFFFRHYDPWVDRYVIYDDGSQDGSLDILRAHPKVELRRFERVDAESFVLSHTRMQEHSWKESRGRADWVVITAIDEHLWVRGRDMRSYLRELRGRRRHLRSGPRLRHEQRNLSARQGPSRPDRDARAPSAVLQQAFRV